MARRLVSKVLSAKNFSVETGDADDDTPTSSPRQPPTKIDPLDNSSRPPSFLSLLSSPIRSPKKSPTARSESSSVSGSPCSEEESEARERHEANRNECFTSLPILYSDDESSGSDDLLDVSAGRNGKIKRRTMPSSSSRSRQAGRRRGNNRHSNHQKPKAPVDDLGIK
jgi:hypothetical protein